MLSSWEVTFESPYQRIVCPTYFLLACWLQRSEQFRTHVWTRNTWISTNLETIVVAYFSVLSQRLLEGAVERSCKSLGRLKLQFEPSTSRMQARTILTFLYSGVESWLSDLTRTWCWQRWCRRWLHGQARFKPDNKDKEFKSKPKFEWSDVSGKNNKFRIV